MMDEINGTLTLNIPKTNTDKTQDTTNFGYYHQFCRLFLANVVLTSQMKQLMNERAELTIRMTKIQKKTQEIENGGSSEDRKKRKRRTAGQIERHYVCVVETCGKSYGSQGSLNQHIKLKHFEVYQTMPQLHNMDSKIQQFSSDQEYNSESIFVETKNKKG